MPEVKPETGRESPLRLYTATFARLASLCLSPGGNLFCRQFLQKLFAQAIKATIGHHQQQIAGARFGGEKIGNSIRSRQDARVFPELANGGSDRFRVEALLLAQLSGAMHAAQQARSPSASAGGRAS